MAKPRNTSIGINNDMYKELQELQQQLDGEFGFKVSITQVLGFLLKEYRNQEAEAQLKWKAFKD